MELIESWVRYSPEFALIHRKLFLSMGFSAKKAYPLVQSIFILLVLLSALCAGLHTVSDYDMGWHLATGRYVVQHHQIPRTDVLSFTSAGKPWAYPPFAGVLLYLTYRSEERRGGRVIKS